MSDGSKYNAYSDIKILLINRIKKKVFAIIRFQHLGF